MDDDITTCSYVDAKYDFLVDLDKYLQYGEEAKSHGDSKNYDNICAFTEINFRDNYREVNEICRKFKYLVDSFFLEMKETTFNETFTVQYLCYWLNDELKKIKNNSVCAKVFHQEMKTKDGKYKGLNVFNENIYDITKKDLSNVQKLIDLYTKYNEINRIISNTHLNGDECINISEKCVPDYKNDYERCSNQSTKFCDALKIFKSKHDSIKLCSKQLKVEEKMIFLRSLTSDIPAPDCQISIYRLNSESTKERSESHSNDPDSSNIDMQSIVLPIFPVLGISVIGFILYKFTLIGSWLHPRVNKQKSILNNIAEKSDLLLYSPQYQ
ncbi:PIR Superfamily Protein [Plasmodium ovale curtisi]|uniref:PIR Superfamily Protein n=1 Tax=Plasmodium ovale curtisi TaxID=864141 RepID=A0A1A8WBL9_PLAOA|nr:PIR Superfamily Protein [Plasmodium ovale curtisi]